MNVMPIGFSTVPLNRTFDVERLWISTTVGAWSRRMSNSIDTDALPGSSFDSQTSGCVESSTWMSLMNKSYGELLMSVTCCSVSRNTHVPPLPLTVLLRTTTSPTPGLTMSCTKMRFRPNCLSAVTSIAIVMLPRLSTNRYGERHDRIRTSLLKAVASASTELSLPCEPPPASERLLVRALRVPWTSLPYFVSMYSARWSDWDGCSRMPPLVARGPAVTSTPLTGDGCIGPPAAPSTFEWIVVLLFASLETQPKRPLDRLNDSERVFTWSARAMRSTPSRPVMSVSLSRTTLLLIVPPTSLSSSPSA